MGLLTDILKEIPQAAVLKEKIADIEAKYAAADTENAILKDDIRKLKAENIELKKQVEEINHASESISEIEMYLLSWFSGDDYQCAALSVLRQDSHFRKIGPTRLDYYLQRLEDLGHLSSAIDTRGKYYLITQSGRALLLQNGMI